MYISGLGFIVIDIVLVQLPAGPVPVNFTMYVPAVAQLYIGFCGVEVAGEKSQDVVVLKPGEFALNCISSSSQNTADVTPEPEPFIT
jgi:hypothetical protein